MKTTLIRGSGIATYYGLDPTRFCTGDKGRRSHLWFPHPKKGYAGNHGSFIDQTHMGWNNETRRGVRELAGSTQQKKPLTRSLHMRKGVWERGKAEDLPHSFMHQHLSFHWNLLCKTSSYLSHIWLASWRYLGWPLFPSVQLSCHIPITRRSVQWFKNPSQDKVQLIVASSNFHLSQGFYTQFQNGAPLTFIEFSLIIFFSQDYFISAKSKTRIQFYLWLRTFNEAFLNWEWKSYLWPSIQCPLSLKDTT